MIFIPKKSLKMRGFYIKDFEAIIYYSSNIAIAGKAIKKFNLRAFYPYKYENVKTNLIKLNRGQFLYVSIWFKNNVIHFKGHFDDPHFQKKRKTKRAQGNNPKLPPLLSP